MELIEHENNDVKDMKIKMKCDYPLCKGLCDSMSSYRSAFFCVICGAPGTGKTTKLVKMLMNGKDLKGKKTSLKKCFHSITVFSPSLHTIDIDNDFFETLDEDKQYDEFNNETLDSYLNNIQNEKETFNNIYNNDDVKKQEGRKDDHPFMNLLILDDVGNSIRGSKLLEERLTKLVQNRRHTNTSIIMLLQNAVQIPPKIRDSARHIYSYKPMSIEEEDRIYSMVKKPKKYQEQFFNFMFREPHDIMYIDKTFIKSPDYVFYRNHSKVCLK